MFIVDVIKKWIISIFYYFLRLSKLTSLRKSIFSSCFSLCVITSFVIIYWNNQTLLINKSLKISKRFSLFQINLFYSKLIIFFWWNTVILSIYLNSSRTIALDTRVCFFTEHEALWNKVTLSNCLLKCSKNISS